jgi:putative peptidoglycan lipid II flippase
VLVVTQLLNLLTVPWFAHAGLAVSISVGALANAGLLLAGLRRRGVWHPTPGWPKFLGQTIASSALLAAALAATVPRFDWIAMRAAPFERIGLTLGLVAGGAIVYLVALLALGVRPMQFVKHGRRSD